MYRNNIVTEGEYDKSQAQLSLLEKLIVLLLFLASVNFKGYGLYFVPLAFVVFCMGKQLIATNIGIVPLLLLSLGILLFDDGAMSDMAGVVKWLVWPLAYNLGYGIVALKGNDKASYRETEKKATLFFSACAIGFFTHIVLNLWINRGDDSIGRNILDYWTGASRAATGQAMIACIPLGFFIASFFYTKELGKRLWILSAILLILYFNLTISTRTIFAMALLIAFVAIFYTMWQSGNQRRIKTLLMVAFLVFLAVLMYDNNIFGIRDTVEESGFYRRFFGRSSQDIAEDNRWDNKLEYIRLMPDYLWGGGYIHRIVRGYAHDLFLDTYDEVGVVAFIALIMLIWSATAKLIRLIKTQRVDFRIRMTVLCIYAALYMEFMIEPIFAGGPELLMIFCFFHGMVTRLVSNAKALSS